MRHQQIWAGLHEGHARCPVVLSDTLALCSRCNKGNYGPGWVELAGHPMEGDMRVHFTLCDDCAVYFDKLKKRLAASATQTRLPRA